MYIQPFFASASGLPLRKTKNLDAIITDILDESSLRNPVHRRRMAHLRVKRNGTSHSDFLMNLEKSNSD